MKTKGRINIIIGTLLPWTITMLWQIISAMFFDKVDMNTTLMFVTVYAVPSLIFCATFSVIFSLLFNSQQWKFKLLAVLILAVFYWLITSLLTTQIEYLIQITAIPLIISFLMIFFLNSKKFIKRFRSN